MYPAYVQSNSIRLSDVPSLTATIINSVTPRKDLATPTTWSQPTTVDLGVYISGTGNSTIVKKNTTLTGRFVYGARSSFFGPKSCALIRLDAT
jgi:hypothetical protein